MTSAKKSGVGTAGIGIGLAIVEKINQALLLNLKMCSVVGTGAQFRFQVRLDSGK
jgi:signal transduction histidine kinase